MNLYCDSFYVVSMDRQVSVDFSNRVELVVSLLLDYGKPNPSGSDFERLWAGSSW